jgi:hypothetical protein
MSGPETAVEPPCSKSDAHGGIGGHSGCPVDKGACNLLSRHVPDAGPCIRVIFLPSTKKHIGFRGDASCHGRFVMSWERSIAIALALHAALSCAAQVKSSHWVQSSWWASTWIYSQ